MASGNLITDYLSSGSGAPAGAPSLAAAGQVAVYENTATGALYVWNPSASAWVTVGATPSLAAASAKYTGANKTYSSGSYADVDSSMNLSITTGAHRVLCLGQFNIYMPTGANGLLDINVDGTLQGGASGLTIFQMATNTVLVTIAYLTAVLSAGSHTIKPQIKGTSSNHVGLDASTDGLANTWQLLETLLTT